MKLDHVLMRLAAKHQTVERDLRRLASKAERIEKQVTIGEARRARRLRPIRFAVSALSRKSAAFEERARRRERALGILPEVAS